MNTGCFTYCPTRKICFRLIFVITMSTIIYFQIILNEKDDSITERNVRVYFSNHIDVGNVNGLHQGDVNTQTVDENLDWSEIKSSNKTSSESSAGQIVPGHGTATTRTPSQATNKLHKGIVLSPTESTDHQVKDVERAFSYSKINISLNNTPTENDSEQSAKSKTLAVDDVSQSCKKSNYFECPMNTMNLTNNKPIHMSTMNWPAYLIGALFRFHTCRHTNCVYDPVISNRTDVVLVHGVDLDDQMVRAKRWPHQTYGFVIFEPPGEIRTHFLKKNVSLWDNYFNFTVSYRTDSDIFVPYGKLKLNPKPLKDRPNYLELAKTKNKTAAWFVSNCDAPSKRLEYVREMQKYVDIDIYGECGIKCTEHLNVCETFPANYKFYLSIESSFCQDYVTEKLFKIFWPNTHVVPVVRGAVDYDRSFPNGTFINAAHFQTPKDLALFLRQLASNLEAYSEVLKRKDDFISDSVLNLDLGCNICNALNENLLADKTCNIRQWLNLKQCYTPNDIGVFS